MELFFQISTQAGKRKIITEDQFNFLYLSDRDHVLG
jgi:hypothetical protein